MSEIKFRAWDKRNDQMLQVSDVSFVSSKGFSSHRCWAELSIEWETVNGEDPEIEDEEHFKELIWLRYTEKIDINSKDIYEGDLLQNKNPRLNNEIYQVVYDVGKGAFLYWRVDNHNVLQEYYGMTDIYDLHVIGNIYLNPELLQ